MHEWIEFSLFTLPIISSDYQRYSVERSVIDAVEKRNLQQVIN